MSASEDSARDRRPEPKGEAPAMPATLSSREATFGHVCRRCSRCCHHKLIRLDPYEVARVARHKGMTTSAFAAAFTSDGTGTALAKTEAGACVLLGPDGCSVHPDRPLACRLYPLGHRGWRGRAEEFLVHVLEPDTAGAFTTTGTVADHLEAQGAEPYIEASWRYFEFLCAADDRLGDIAAAPNADPQAARAIGAELFDMDSAIAKRCAERGIAEPAAIQARLDLHLAILYDALDDMAEAIG